MERLVIAISIVCCLALVSSSHGSIAAAGVTERPLIVASNHVHVGALEGDARAGGIVFIPRNTWVSLRNVGKTPISMLFAFNAPGFDRYMRCESVPAGKRPTTMTDSGDRICTRLGDVQYR